MKTPPSRRPPTPFGQYLLLERIGIGTLAEVWRARQFLEDGSGRFVAIKRLLPYLCQDQTAILTLLQEARIGVQLPHGNIAQVHELGQLENLHYIAMEYIPGKDLRALFNHCRKRGEPVPVPLACYVIAKACEGLDYAHRKKSEEGRELGIVHGGVSPQDVLISYEGDVKVIDFGFARSADSGTPAQLGVIQGKSGYMSPEQSLGLPVDRRSDVFALGACLYELLTGQRLFEADSGDPDADALAVLEKTRKAEVTPPSVHNKNLPEGLEQVVLHALAREADQRSPSAGELGGALQRFLTPQGAGFGRMDLKVFMQSTFDEDLKRERQREQEALSLEPPAGAGGH